MKKTMSFFCRITLMILAFVTGASSGVMMAEASNLPDAGMVDMTILRLCYATSCYRIPSPKQS